MVYTKELSEDMNKQQLAIKIWESANRMRSKIEANEYKDYILGFVFYKFLSDTEVKFLIENDFTYEDIYALSVEDSETKDFIQKNLGYFIAHEDLFSTWISKGNAFDVSNVFDALNAFNRNIYKSHNKVFSKIFDTLQTGLGKLGDSSGAQTKAIVGLIQLIKDIPMDGKQDYDILGFIYEYLIGMFAANAGKKAGEFYTPHEVSLLMSEIVAYELRGRNKIEIYDPTSGSGSLLINIGKSVSKHVTSEENIKYYAQEIKENTYNLTRMNLVMRGIKPDNIETRNGDTLEEDWPYFDENDPINTYNPLYVDAVVSNPPYSQAWDPQGKESDPRYIRFGIAPRGKADFAFLLHDLYHVKPDGVMTIVLPHGVLFRGGEEGTIRKNLIENNHIDTIIGLPANIFFGTGIPTIVLVLKQKRENTDVLVIDASKGFSKEGKNNKLRSSDIKRITDTYILREDIEKYARVVSREEIRSNDYNLNIPRYVDSSVATETWDLYASMFGGIPKAEIDALSDYWAAFPDLKYCLFSESDTPYVELKAEDIKTVIRQHPNVVEFENELGNVFSNFQGFLKNYLIDDLFDLEIRKAETIIGRNLFQCLNNTPLIDVYELYQVFSEQWESISIDLEVLQSEGFDSVRRVDPRMLIKKKDGKDIEVQEGWEGRIFPFDLVKKVILQSEFHEITDIEESLMSIPSKIEEIFESLSEEERESCSDVISENNNAFVYKDLPKLIRILDEDDSDESLALRDKIERVVDQTQQEKTLRSLIKQKNEALDVKVKETIQRLSNDEVAFLLEEKWITPIIERFNDFPEAVVDKLFSRILSIQSKYDSTITSISQEIRETEAQLSAMIDELEGNDFDMLGLQEFKAYLGG